MPIVLLVTAMDWPFAAQLAGAFTAVGARVEALCPPGRALSLSRYPKRFHRYRAMAPDASVSRAIQQSRADLVIPCDDMAAEIVQRVTGGQNFGHRHQFLTRAAAAGAPARSMALESKGDVADALAHLGLPLVVKSDHSWGGAGVAIAPTRQAAFAAFERFTRRSRLRDLVRFIRRGETHFLSRALSPVDPAISAQAFIDGHPATSSLACWQGEVVAANHFDVLVTSDATGPACVVGRRQCPQMIASAAAIARTFNLSGLFGLDYVRDHAGQVHLLEMNARATPTAHLMMGEDLPAALLRSAGLPASPRPPVTTKTDVAIFPREWMRDPASPWLKNAYHDVPWDDPDVVGIYFRPTRDQDPDGAPAGCQDGESGILTTENPVFRG